MARVLIAKTSLDGHWRGTSVVARALRDGGFEVVFGGMLRPSEIARAALDEDVDLVGLNVGGRVEVVERVLDELESAGLSGIPVFGGCTIPPWAAQRLRARGMHVHPPGSSLEAIVESARALTSGTKDAG